MTPQEEALELHRKLKGKLSIKSKVPIDKESLRLAYTPGVAEPCKEIAKDKSKVYEYTGKGNSVAVVSDGSAVLGLGNIGALAGLPVMEGKALLFNELAGIDSIPIILDTQETHKIIETVKNIAPSFGGINLEDIQAPRCFEVEEALQEIGIPVFHDDQHGTAIVVAAALINACRASEKEITDLKVVVSGAGAAGTAVTKMLMCFNIAEKLCSPVKDVITVDSKGIIYRGRDSLDFYKGWLASSTNKENRKGSLADALVGADVFIGVSKAGLLTEAMVKSMNKDPIVFAMANPVPEIDPVIAKKAGALIVGTGRSDYPNQINNVLAFPGVFRGALDAKATKITPEMKAAAFHALADYVKNPGIENILPSPLDKGATKVVAEAVKKAAIEGGFVRKD
ncbi:MAG: NADP-dependent malic enzyme [Candidatus Aenigmarchaeota archaeon]|nr:NADP-dependent malic enzyme [Candidatus Aenigmarchaeota archaeon]